MRLIAATNRDLAKLVAEGRFREDLYYRLNVVPIHIPPLRERREDIPALVNFFLERCNRRHSRYKVFSRELMDHLASLPWKGNIRELENAVERLVVTSPAQEVGEEEGGLPVESDVVAADRPLRDQLEACERRILLQARRRYGTRRRIAEVLGISQASVSRKLRKIGRNH